MFFSGHATSHTGCTNIVSISRMIDDLVALLAKEQAEDDEKKDWCLTELDTSDDTKKALEHDIADLEKAIADAEEAIATLTSEIKVAIGHGRSLPRGGDDLWTKNTAAEQAAAHVREAR